MELLVLDYKIGTWVMFPIVLMVLLCTLLRQKLADTNPKTDTQPDMQQQFVSSVLLQSQLTRGAALFILSPFAFYSRKLYLICNANERRSGVLWNPPNTSATRSLENFAKQDPTAAFSAMKSQLAFVMLQGLFAYLINLFFSGFVVAKIPFSLPYTFKAMLQRGIEVQLLDVTYVSSLSWYFLVMLSINGIYYLFYEIINYSETNKNKKNFDFNSAANLKAFAGLPAGGAAAFMPAVGGPDPKKLFKQERDALQIVQPTNAIQQMPFCLLREWSCYSSVSN